MKFRSAVVFPDTVPTEQMLIPLVLVFEPLVYFQTVENDHVPQEMTNTFIDEMTATPLCRIEVPAPLEEDRERFLQLITDIRTRRDDYVAQLSHVSLAAVSSASRPGRESKSSIVANLLAGKGIRETEADSLAMELWQARLVLKLGEIFDADQENLRLDLKKLDNKQDSLLGELRKESGSLFARTGEISASSPMTGAMVQLRCKAWARLYVSGQIRVQDKPIFVSSNREAVELLIDTFEQVTGRPPLQKCFFSLPAVYPDKSRFQEQLRQFRNEGAGVVEKLYDMLAAGGEGVAPDFMAENWDTLVEKFFPENQCGRSLLRLYFYPGSSAQQIFAETFTHDEKGKLDTAGTGFFLGVLNP